MGVLGSRLDPGSDAYRANRDANQELLAELDRLLAEARAGGGPKYVERHRARGKLLARERVELLVDRDGPFLGTVGVAPRRERRLSLSQSPEYLGDVDQPAVTAGATLRLPVNVEGALVALGDAHGAQGDGEITGAAVEIEAEVELTLRARDREEAGFVALPQLDTAEAIGSLAGLHGADLTSCARAAYTDLVERLRRGHGFSRADAYHLLGQVGRLRVGNMLDPFFSVLATVERRYLEPS
jgi:amidase